MMPSRGLETRKRKRERKAPPLREKNGLGGGKKKERIGVHFFANYGRESADLGASLHGAPPPKKKRKSSGRQQRHLAPHLLFAVMELPRLVSTVPARCSSARHGHGIVRTMQQYTAHEWRSGMQGGSRTSVPRSSGSALWIEFYSCPEPAGFLNSPLDLSLNSPFYYYMKLSLSCALGGHRNAFF